MIKISFNDNVSKKKKRRKLKKTSQQKAVKRAKKERKRIRRNKRRSERLERKRQKSRFRGQKKRQKVSISAKNIPVKESKTRRRIGRRESRNRQLTNTIIISIVLIGIILFAGAFFTFLAPFFIPSDTVTEENGNGDAIVPKSVYWDTDLHFDYSDAYGSPTYLDSQVLGSGGTAKIILSQKTDEVSNVPFTYSGNYTFNSSEILVSDGNARLFPNNIGYWNFTDPTEYGYNSSEIIISGDVAKLNGTPTTPYLWYNFNENSGDNAFDFSYNGRNGTTNNMEDGDWVSGKLNNALNLDGVNEWVDLNSDALLTGFERTDTFSFSMWFKTNASTTAFFARYSQGWKGQHFGLVGGRLRLALSNLDENRLIVETGSGLGDNSWHHVVATYNGTSSPSGVGLFIDGGRQTLTVVRDTLSLSILSTLANPTIMRIGEPIHFYYAGIIDEGIIFNKDLTDNEVSYLYNNGSGTEKPIDPYTTSSLITNESYVFADNLSSFVETATIPTATNIKYQLSYDNGSNWNWYNGTEWVNTTNSYNESNVASVVNASIGELNETGILKLKIFFESNSTLTPELDAIEITGLDSYILGGFELEMNFDITPDFVLSWVSIIEDSMILSGTGIFYQYSSNGGTSYNGAWLSVSLLENVIQNIVMNGDGTDILRFKISLNTSNPTATPRLDNLEITSDAGYENSGSYTSKIVNTIEMVKWAEVSYSIMTPTGTTATITFRFSSNLLDPLSDYRSIISGDIVNYFSYEVQFIITFSSNGISSPSLNSVQIEYITQLQFIIGG